VRFTISAQVIRASDGHVFRIGRLSTDELQAIATRACDDRPTYQAIGAVLGPDSALPRSFRHDHHEASIGDDPDAFSRAVLGLQQWVPHRGAGLMVQPDDPPKEGATVAIARRVGPLTAIAACRVVRVICEPDRCGFVYGTLPGHPECGEEAFLVERRESQTVFVIRAFSKPAEFLARLGGPITRRIQRSTTQAYLDALVDFVGAPKQ
jgi:uncharacterized protein (UPF0548 family)